ncbi:MAG: substrate-binding domain-containing protein [Chloroflexota bacterium]
MVLNTIGLYQIKEKLLKRRIGYYGRYRLFGWVIIWMGLLVVSCQPTNNSAITAAPPLVMTATQETAVSPTSTPQTRIKIGAILFQNDNFFETVALGMEEAAQAADIDIHFRFHEQDVALETQWILEFTEQDFDAIIISPRVKDGSIAAIQKAYEAGVTIICYNGCFTDDITEQYVSALFETDQYALGYQVGEYLANWLTERDIKDPQVGIVSCCERRNKGFRQALTDNEITWQETANLEGYLPDAATIVGETILQNNPQITILWAENEGGTIGAVSAVRRLELDGQVYVFGIDISPQLAQMLLDDDNILQAVGAQSPRLMGNLAVQAALDTLSGEKPTSYNIVPNTFYSRDNPEAIEAYLQEQ